MTDTARRGAALALGGSAGLVSAVTVLLSGCAAAGPAQAGTTPHRTDHAEPARSAAPASRSAPGGQGRAGTGSASHPSAARRVGRFGSFPVAQRLVTFTEPAHAGPAGGTLGPRRLLTQVLYPRAVALDTARGHPPPARGALPMLVFAPGFMQCGTPYRHLLRSWASAGFVVVVVNFPHADCRAGSAATESDLQNEPADLSYVITRMLNLSTAANGPFAGLIAGHEIGIAGQSDGGDVVAAIGANSCCADRRVAAVAVLSGAEWPPMAGSYFGRRPVPMLFAQGSADTINPSGCSVVLYQADPARARYYLDLFGASHTGPYWGANQYERIVARVTLAFFDRYVLGQSAAGQAMRGDGTVPGLATLLSDGHGQFPSRYCNT
jgi:dienelactone hydrolase